MRVTKLYVRFFRSFNYDYERKANPKAKAKPWEYLDDAWYPFIRIDLDPVVTAVVGANESGKSHLIEAIKHALTGEQIDHRDFCRYSALFSVETGKVRSPDFGVELEVTDEEDSTLLAELSLVPNDARRFTLFRLDEGQRNIFIGSGEDEHELDPDRLKRLQSTFPKPFQLHTEVPVPDSVSLDSLLGDTSIPLHHRRKRGELIELLQGIRENPAQTITDRAGEIANYLQDDLNGEPAAETNEGTLTQTDLGRELLINVAKISKTSIKDLLAALRAEDEGTVAGLVGEMNKTLARHLNFSRWWRQDREFQLRLSPRDRDIVFTIHDRTGTDYSFKERSKGLRYFLSYYVQLRAHRQQAPGGPEILLMDEPDAYLSSIGQQDLLRALEDFARPEDGSRKDQVVYVTHSPFLINKNAAHRIRVLDKGSNEEGTRVVRDVAQNHYEPLRSSLGAYVAETAFIGGSNLLVEGVSDQVLLTAMTSLLRRRRTAATQLLDLNEVTIVPAGSASSVPYVAYLARGRDQLKPACAALLDGDKPGRDAIKKLQRSDDGRRKPILADDYILDLGAWAKETDLQTDSGVEVTEPEDLIPAPIAAEAAQRYAIQFLEATQEEARSLSGKSILSCLTENQGSLWRSLEQAFAKAFDGGHIEKVGFAKELANVVDAAADSNPRPTGFPKIEHNFGKLIAELAGRLRNAEITELDQRTNNRTDHTVQGFLRDHPDGATRDAANHLLGEIESNLEDTIGDEAVRHKLLAMRHGFQLTTDPQEPVPSFDDFCQQLKDLPSVRRQAYKDAAAIAPAKRRARNKRPSQAGSPKTSTRELASEQV